MKKLITLTLLSFMAFSSSAMAKKITYLKGEFKTITPGDDVYGTGYVTKAQNGNYYVVLGDDFETHNRAPDLRVVLHKEVRPSSYTKDNSIFLGRLKEIKGKQMYKVPANASLKGIKSIVI